MSPVPSPVPLRRKLSRFLFSPTGLLFAFVVLLITTCPGARGEGGFDQLLAMEIGASAADITAVPVSVAAAPAPRVIGRSTRFDRPRVPTAVEGSERATAGGDSLRDDRLPVLPLLNDPLFDDAAGNPPPRIRPMIGPTVGVQPQQVKAAR